MAWSTIETASARFSGSTSSENSLFEAASIELTVDDDGGESSRLLVEADGLYPGLVIERCLVVTHRGSLDDVSVRLFGSTSGTADSGEDLAPYLLSEVQLGSGSSPDCVGFQPRDEVYAGRLSELWRQHGTFDDGLLLIPEAGDGDAVTVRLGFEVESDDRAQGLTTAFVVTVEARP